MSEPTTTEQLPNAVEILQSKLPHALVSHKVEFGQLYLCIHRDQLPAVILTLKENPDLQFDYFVECLGVDYSKFTHQRDFSERFEVVYNLMALSRAERIFVKLAVDDGQTVPTLKHIFPGAEYPEREIWDLFGIIFEGNEQTQRFLLPDDWVGYPLRKEYPLGGEEVLFDKKDRGPAIADIPRPRAGESFDGKTGTKEITE